MLELRPTCEHCNKSLAPDATDAMICSFECTYCRDCVQTHLNHTCPNCGGGFTSRPIRPQQNWRNGNCLENYPASEKVVHKPVDFDAHRQLCNKIGSLAPEQR